MRRTVALLLSVSLVGCATTVPYTGAGPHPQIERGAPFLPIDFLGNVLSLPSKLILWNRKFNNHAISPETEAVLVAYLGARDLPALGEAKFRLNQYRPLQDLSRLVKNHHVAWPYRFLIGFPVTLIGDVLLPGRLFPWGDYYNPYTNTVHLFSDGPAVVLHEASHVHDFASRRYKGSYATLRIIPFVDLYQEYKASKEALAYLRETHDRPEELDAYKVLYPAYGTYMGSYFFPVIGPIVGALVGHGLGRYRSARQRRAYDEADQATEDASAEESAEPPSEPQDASPAPALP